MRKIPFFLAMICCANLLHAQTIKVLTSGTKTSLRGLSVVNDNVLWVSGSGGKVARSIDGGASFKWTTVKGFERTEFRDIEAFDENTAIIIAIDSPAIILKTIDAGESWKEVYRNDTKGMFLDAMDFFDNKYGVVVGDPLDGKFFLARTSDAGETWQEVVSDKRPDADNGEACFASSGTNIRMMSRNKVVFISGGKSSHIFINGKKTLLPLLQGKESTGANSVAIKNNAMMIAVGGDFNTKDSTEGNCTRTESFAKFWRSPDTSPYGYRSCIEYLHGDTWLTCGLNGVDISNDNGSNFTRISTEGFHVCRRAKHGNFAYFAGNNGKIGRLL